MKKRVKSGLALLLAVSMAIPMFSVSAMAADVKPAAFTETLSVQEENQLTYSAGTALQEDVLEKGGTYESVLERRNIKADTLSDENMDGKIYSYKYVRDTDGIEAGKEYMITWPYDETNGRLLFCSDVTANIITVTITGNETEIHTGFNSGYQVWKVLEAEGGLFSLQSINGNKPANYLDLTVPATSPFVKTPGISEGEALPTVSINAVEGTDKYTIQGVSGNGTGKYFLKNEGRNNGKWITSETGSADTEKMHFYEKVVDESVPPVSALGMDVGNLFTGNDPDNVWVFTGGEAVMASFSQTRTARNYIGHFEEYIRWIKRGGNTNARQRYTINEGEKGRDLAEIVSEWEQIVTPSHPKAVSFFLGKEDYEKGSQGLEAFGNSLKQFITKSLEQKENNGFAVIQLPFYTGEEEEEELINLYKEKVTSVVDNRDNGFITDLTKYKRIVIIDHHAKTKAIDNWTSEYLTNGMPNEKGHIEIGRQLAEATIKATDSFPTAASLSTRISYGPEKYLEEGPQIEAGADNIRIKFSDEILAQYGNEYEYELTLSDSGQEKTVVKESINIGEDGEYNITGLTGSLTFMLQLRTNDGLVQFATMEGTLGEHASVSGQMPVAFTDKGTDKQKELAQLLSSNKSLRWLFVGDSITHGAAFTNHYDSIAQLFEKYLKDDLHRTGDTVINSAVAGAVTADNTNNGNDAYRLDWEADVVLVMLGTNDAAVTGHCTKEEYIAHFNTLLEKIRLHNPNAMIIFRTPVYTSANDQAGRATNLYHILDALKEMAVQETEGEPNADFYIDQYTPSALALVGFPWLYPNGNGRDQVYADNVHPNELGHLMMFSQLIRELGLWKNDMPFNDVLYHTVNYGIEGKDDLTEEELLVNETDKSITLDVNKLAERIPQLGSVTFTATSVTTGKSYTKSLDRTVTVDTSARTVTVSWPDNTRVVLEGISWDDMYEVTVTGWSTGEAKKFSISKELILGNSTDIILRMNYLYNQENVPVEAGTEIGMVSVFGAESAEDLEFTIENATDALGNQVLANFEIEEGRLVILKDLEEGQEYTVTVKAVKGEASGTGTFTFTAGKKASTLDNPVVGTNLSLDTKDSRYLIYDITYENNDNNPVQITDTPYTRVLYDDGGSSTGWLKYYNTWHTEQEPKYLWKLTATDTSAAYEMRSQRQYDGGWPLYAPYGDYLTANGKQYLFALSRKIAGGSYNKISDLAKVMFKVMGQDVVSLGGEEREVVYVALVAEGKGKQEGKTFYLSTEDGNMGGSVTTNIRTYAHWLQIPDNGEIPQDKGWWVLEEVPGAVDGKGDIPGRELLFRTSALEYHYRIPAIATVNNGNIITAIDYRFHSNADIGMNWTNWDGTAWRRYERGHQIDLHTRITRNNGDSWETAINRTEGLSIAPDIEKGIDANGYGDPALVADRESDNVLLVSVSGVKGYSPSYNGNGIEASYMLSEDGGENFSDPVKISDQIYGRFNPSDTANYESALNGQGLNRFFFASGKIHQSRYIKVGTHYRIYSAILGSSSSVSNFNYVMYSDDFGKNWHVLGNTTAIPNGGDEAKVEELPNGDVVITSRIHKGRKVNIFKYDENDPDFKSGRWGEATDMELAPNCNNGCNGEVYVVYAKRNDTNEYGYLILQSLPTGTNRYAVKIFYRWLEPGADLTVQDFADTTKWSSVEDSFLLQDGKSCYSTMILQPDGKLGVVWEEGLHEYDIVYKALELTEITKGQFDVAFPAGGIGAKDTPYLITNEEEQEAADTVYGKEKVHFRKVKSHTVTFDSQGGTLIPSVSANTNDTIMMPAEPTREGYAFGGWFTKPDGAGVEFTAGTKVTEDITLYAKWIPMEEPTPGVTVYTVVFDSQGGSEVASVSVNEGGTIGDLPEPTREGYDFGGWFTKADGTGSEFTKDTAVNGNITLYAKWILKDIPGTEEPDKPGVSDNEPENPDKPGVSDNDPEREIPEGIWVSGIEDAEYNGKKITFSKIKVYDGEQLLKEKVDYTISYKNNTNAYTFTEEALEDFEKKLATNPKLKEVTGFNSKKAPQVVIKMKGNYTGTKNIYFNIYPLDISELDDAVTGNDNGNSASGNTVSGNTASGNETGKETANDLLGKTDTFYIDDISATHTGKKQKVTPVVLWQEGGRNLKLKKEFTVTPDLSTITASGEHPVTIKGTGNFTGERTITYTIGQPGEISVSKLSVKAPKSVTYDTKAQEPEITVKNKKETLVKNKDYTVEYDNNVAAGVASIIITGTEGANGGTSYIGTRRITLKINGTSMAKAKLEGLDKSYPFVRKEIEPVDGKSVKVTVAGKTLTPETDYVIRYENNVYQGTASVIVTGNPEAGYVGSKTFKFKIAPTPISTAKDSGFTFTFKNAEEGNKYPFVKGGVKPSLEIKYKGSILREGVDYTLSYKNNKAVTKNALVAVNGKGDFAKTKENTLTFEIVQKDTAAYPGQVYLDLKDIVENKVVKQNFKVVDIDGKVLTKKKDYQTTVVYKLVSADHTAASQLGTIKVGDTIDNLKQKLPAGCVVEITVELAGNNYKGKVTGTYRIIKAENDISKAKIQLNPQEYTGEEVTVSGNDIFKKPVTLKNGTKLSMEGSETNIEIVRYQNNVKKGTAKVTFRGTGKLGGYKTVTFKITPRSVSKNWEGVFEDLLGILSF